MANRNTVFGISESVFRFDHLEPRVQTHLKNVYSCLTLGMLTAALGAYIHMLGILQLGVLSLIGSVGFMFWLHTTANNKQDQTKRTAIYTAFTFCTGMGLGPLLDYALIIDPSIIVTSLLGTFVIFGGFSLAALYNSDRKFLYLGGTLISFLSWLLILGLVNIFFRSQLLFDINLYLGFFLFAAFVLYDTQLIVEKRRNGDDDFIWHSVDLFLDFINIFRRLLIILSKKENNKKNRN